MILSHSRRRREPPVSLRCGEFRSSFGKSNLYFRKREHLQRQNKGFGDPYVNQYTFQFTEENHMFFSHYRRRRDPPVSLSCGEFRSSFGKSNLYFRKREPLQRQNKGFGDPVNQYTFEKCIVLYKETKINTLLNLAPWWGHSSKQKKTCFGGPAKDKPFELHIP